MRLEHLINRRVIVERRDERVGENARGHAGARRRDAAGRQTAARLHEHRVGMTVVTAFELENRVATRGRARDAQRGHHGFGARRHEPQPLDPRQAAHDPFGERERIRLARAERPAVVHGLVHGGRDVGIRVAEDQRPEALAEIDVAAAVDVNQVRSGAPAEKDRLPADALERANGAVNAARRDALGSRE